MNKKITTGILVGVFLIGIVNAGLVSYLSNSVSGDINIEGPIFYLDKVDIMDDGSYSLKLNNDSVDGTYFKLKSHEFFSESLDIDSFYDNNFKISLNTKVYGLENNQSSSIDITMYIAREDGSIKEKLCNILKIGIDEDGLQEIPCEVSGDGMDDMEKTDRLKLLIHDGSPANAYLNIYLKDSKVEVISQ